MGSADRVPYGNHAHRVANLCLALRPGDADIEERVAIAAVLYAIR